MNDYKWLEYFFEHADFGPAHEDVVEMIYEDYKKRGGEPVDYMEEQLMKYTRIETVGNNSIEHIVEGDYEEVLALFTEMNAKDTVEYHGFDWASGKDQTVTNVINR